MSFFFFSIWCTGVVLGFGRNHGSPTVLGMVAGPQWRLKTGISRVNILANAIVWSWFDVKMRDAFNFVQPSWVVFILMCRCESKSPFFDCPRHGGRAEWPLPQAEQRESWQAPVHGVRLLFCLACHDPCFLVCHKWHGSMITCNLVTHINHVSGFR